MDRKIVLGLLVIILLAGAIVVLMPGGRPVDTNPKLPWMIEVNSAGESRVFDLTPGRSTLADAEKSLQSSAKINLFRSPEGKFAVEAFFDRIYLSGLKASFVMPLEVRQQQASGIFDRGLRISRLDDGTRKVELSETDKQQLHGAVIDLITYLPGTDLDADLIEKHFGRADEKIAGSDDVTHWLYPAKGLDIAVSAEGKEVFQYLSPMEFDRVRSPLKSLTGARQ